MLIVSDLGNEMNIKFLQGYHFSEVTEFK